ncbi:MAG: ribonuclease PH [Planctomycetes bacterium]|nr:ribonuclease PH [Planctomycetota bacterium]
MPRSDSRAPDQLRPVTFQRHFLEHTPGSVLVAFGATRVLCTATIQHSVPSWLEGRGQGWITAEYGMLPASTPERKPRERGGKVDGRTSEIQRLIGRSIRAVVDLELLGERTLWIDCDVIEADGGTRTAAITGAYVALVDAIRDLEAQGLKFPAVPVKDSVAAVSVGVLKGEPMLDLCYEEDSKADIDMNVVLTGKGLIVEIQGTAEKTPFDTSKLMQLYKLAEKGAGELRRMQLEALKK